MVTAKLYGRLGNQLFQKAAAIGYGIKHGVKYSTSGQHLRNRIDIIERKHNYQELPFEPFWEHQNVLLDGYWQSESYFSHCKDQILKEFGFNWQHRPGWCSIHVRRGDYLKYPDKHPVVTASYLNKAINYIISKGITQFIFFSDDIPWCRSYVQIGEWNTHVTIRYSEGLSEKEDLELMSSCEHNIISNSTFSWWGAWLNRNPNKIVISPSKDNWFGPGNAHLDTTDLIPDYWIQIKY